MLIWEKSQVALQKSTINKAKGQRQRYRLRFSVVFLWYRNSLEMHSSQLKPVEFNQPRFVIAVFVKPILVCWNFCNKPFCVQIITSFLLPFYQKKTFTMRFGIENDGLRLSSMRINKFFNESSSTLMGRANGLLKTSLVYSKILIGVTVQLKMKHIKWTSMTITRSNIPLKSNRTRRDRERANREFHISLAPACLQCDISYHM